MHNMEGGGCREIMLGYQAERIYSHFFLPRQLNNITGMLAG